MYQQRFHYFRDFFLLMPIRSTDCQCKRYSSSIKQNVAFCANFTSVGWIASCFFLSKWGFGRAGINTLPFPINAYFLIIDNQTPFVHLLENSQFNPFLKTGMNRTRASKRAWITPELPNGHESHSSFQTCLEWHSIGNPSSCGKWCLACSHGAIIRVSHLEALWFFLEAEILWLRSRLRQAWDTSLLQGIWGAWTQDKLFLGF